MLKLVHSENAAGPAVDDVLIHVRHLPNGQVMTIDRQPPQLTAQEWRDQLLAEAPQYYQTFANARGFFRLPRNVYDTLIVQITPLAAE
jgi:hypothetical protein